MNLIERNITNGQALVENQSDGSILIKSQFVVGDLVNGNRRIYSSKIIKREIDTLNQKIAMGNSVFSMPYHQDKMNIPDVSHLIQKLEFDEKTKTGTATVKILNNQHGQNIRNILQAGGKLGLSMRGGGHVVKRGEVDIVQEDYKLYGIDVVLAPAFKDASFTKENVLSESIDYDKKTTEKTLTLTESQIQAKFIAACYAGFEGTKKDFIKRILKKV